jgi:hypothetical protein
VRKWSDVPLREGAFSVALVQVEDPARVEPFLTNLSVFRTKPLGEVSSLLERVQHVGPQVVVAGVDQSDAVRLKVALEQRGATVKIRESGPVHRDGGGRAPIPEHVRHEVWRRDAGQCVDCGTRERLEFDHIVPVSRGGANTARNIELRCEPCNRKKGATI